MKRNYPILNKSNYSEDNSVSNTILLGEQFNETKGFTSEGFNRHSGERVAAEGEDIKVLNFK